MEKVKLTKDMDNKSMFKELSREMENIRLIQSSLHKTIDKLEEQAEEVIRRKEMLLERMSNN